MSKELNKEELEALETQEGAYATIMGYLIAERGQIAPAVFNKMVVELNYPKMNIKELREFAEVVNGDELLSNLYNRAVRREIKLDDIPNYIAEEGNLKEEELHSKTTNYLADHEQVLANRREMNHFNRQGARTNMMLEGLKKHTVEELKGMPRAKYLETKPIKPNKGDKSLVLLVSDWHVGALTFNENSGGYNFEKLTGTVQDLSDKVIEISQAYDINDVHIYHVGDIIEHISMRNVNQAFESEFPATEQIAKAQRLIVDMLTLVSKHVHVTYGMVAGNHDRFDGNKNDNVYNDNVAYIILEGLFMLQDTFGQLPNVTLVDNRKDTYEIHKVIAGKRFLIAHGDREKRNEKTKIPKHIKEYPIDYYVNGHLHTTQITQEDYSRFHIYVGSTMGANNFGQQLNLPTTDASQMLLVLTEGSKTPMFVPLMLDKQGKVN